MCEYTNNTIIHGRIDDLGRLLMTTSQMNELGFVENEEVILDFSDEGIIIAKPHANTNSYERIKVMHNGVLIGRGICHSKLLMTDEKKIVDSITTNVYDVNGTYLRDDIIKIVYYKIEYRIDINGIVIPLTEEQQKAKLQILRSVDEFGRIVIPTSIRNMHDIKTETGIEVRGYYIIISNNITRKTKVDNLGMITIPQDILDVLEIEPKMELAIKTNNGIILERP